MSLSFSVFSAFMLCLQYRAENDAVRTIFIVKLNQCSKITVFEHMNALDEVDFE